MKRQFLWVVLLIAILGISQAGFTQAVRYYVDVQEGNDGWDGLRPDHPSSPPYNTEGPFKTIGKAMAAGAPGDTISIAYAEGNLYIEDVIINDGFVFVVTDPSEGRPNIKSWFSKADHEIVDPLTINTVLCLDGPSSLITGGDQLWMADGSQLWRNNGELDSQLNFETGAVVDYFYYGGSWTDTGFEVPTPTDMTSMGDFTTYHTARPGNWPATGIWFPTALPHGSRVRMGSSFHMNGRLHTGQVLDVNGQTLGIIGADTDHRIRADVNNSAPTMGSLSFDLTPSTGAPSTPSVRLLETGGSWSIPDVNVSSSSPIMETLVLNHRGTTGG